MVARVAVVTVFDHWRSGNASLYACGYLRCGKGSDAGRRVEATARQIILGNTFRLWLLPGREIMKLHVAICTIYAVERAVLYIPAGGSSAPAIFVVDYRAGDALP